MAETVRDRWKKAEETRGLPQLLRAMEEAREPEEMLILVARRQADAEGDTDSEFRADFECFVEATGLGRRFWEESPEGWEDSLRKAKQHCELPDADPDENGDEKWLDIPWKG